MRERALDGRGQDGTSLAGGLLCGEGGEGIVFALIPDGSSDRCDSAVTALVLAARRQRSASTETLAIGFASPPRGARLKHPRTSSTPGPPVVVLGSVGAARRKAARPRDGLARHAARLLVLLCRRGFALRNREFFIVSAC